MATLFDLDETAGRTSYIDAIIPEDRDSRKKAYQRAFETGILDYQGRIKRKSGELRWLRIKGTVYYNKAAEPVRLLGVVQDVTHERELESQPKSFKGKTDKLE